jgi:6-pyruvoyltetrahydropterin/6-carboxytetrahydropterin synthase
MTLWVSHVEAEFSAAHHNGPEGHKCLTNHGHDWKAEVEFTYDQLDEVGWGPDFGAVKAIIRELDHKDLNELFMPAMRPSAENIARWLYEQFADRLGRMPTYVKVQEAAGNWVIYHGNY